MADRNFGPRMAKHWHVIPGLSQSMTGNGVFLGGNLGLDGPWTCIRMLGEYIIGVDAAPTAQDAVSIGVAIGVASTDALIIGATAIPSPISEPQFPWLRWAVHDFFFNDTSLADGNARSIRVPFDSRSMRKLKPREALFVVAEYADTAGAPPMQIEHSQVRVLVAD